MELKLGGYLMKYFLHTDMSVVENKLAEINQHFSIPTETTTSYSTIIETEDGRHGFLVKLNGKYNTSSFFSASELFDYTPPPPPEEETEETAE